ncbi:uncharacterized protein TNCV_621001 [Trichonephila clavipes]|nr:uncharacterized protein TNCV_621001 [Trichonephila clavipes]
MRLVEGKERWEDSDHPQGVLPRNWGGNELNCTVTCMVLKAMANDRRHLAMMTFVGLDLEFANQMASVTKRRFPLVHSLSSKCVSFGTRGRRKRKDGRWEKWEDVRAMVLELHPNQVDVSRVGDLYNDNAINYFRKILKRREKQSTLNMFFNAH